MTHRSSSVTRKRAGRRPVAVERGADLAAVGKGDRSRPVPRLHQRGVILVERAALGRHQRIAGPSFRDQHHHRVAEAVAAREQQLEGVVEAGGVRLAVRDQRPHLVEIGAEQVRFQRAAARVHPVHVAANGVDLTIVRHEAVGVRKLPAGEGVGAEPLVHQAQRRNAVRIAQVVVKRAHLRCQQQALVDDRAGRKAGHVQLGQARQPMLLGHLRQRVLRLLADHQQLALERVLVCAVGPARDEALADDRHRGDHGVAQAIKRNRNVSPADQRLAFLLDELLERLRNEVAARLVLRHEAHCHAVVAQRR